MFNLKNIWTGAGSRMTLIPNSLFCQNAALINAGETGVCLLLIDKDKDVKCTNYVQSYLNLVYAMINGAL